MNLDRIFSSEWWQGFRAGEWDTTILQVFITLVVTGLVNLAV